MTDTERLDGIRRLEAKAARQREILGADETILSLSLSDLQFLLARLDAAKARVQQLEEALRFYASCTAAAFAVDRGRRACVALGGTYAPHSS